MRIEVPWIHDAESVSFPSQRSRDEGGALDRFWPRTTEWMGKGSVEPCDARRRTSMRTRADRSSRSVSTRVSLAWPGVGWNRWGTFLPVSLLGLGALVGETGAEDDEGGGGSSILSLRLLRDQNLFFPLPSVGAGVEDEVDDVGAGDEVGVRVLGEDGGPSPGLEEEVRREEGGGRDCICDSRRGFEDAGRTRAGGEVRDREAKARRAWRLLMDPSDEWGENSVEFQSRTVVELGLGEACGEEEDPLL